MTRLTTRSAHDHAVPTEFDLDFAWDISKAEWAGLQRIFDYLADYEDTRYTPEDFDRLCREMSDIRMQVCDTTYDRIRELVQVNKDGRCVVLPYKVGDTVYWADEDIGDVLAKSVIGFTVNVSKYDVTVDGFVQAGVYVKALPFGTCLFLTRAEAEAALKGAEHD